MAGREEGLNGAANAQGAPCPSSLPAICPRAWEAVASQRGVRGAGPPCAAIPGHSGRRALNAAASVPSSSTSRAPPMGTPWASRVIVAPVGFRRSVR